MAVIPAAILVVLKTGVAGSNATGAARSPAQHASAARATPTTVPGSGNQPASGQKVPGKPAQPGKVPRTPNSVASPVRSFIRMTEVKLSAAPNGDYEHITETARVTIRPVFALDAIGVRDRMRDGKLTRRTQKMILTGRTMRTYDGRAWHSTVLNAAQLAALRNDSDSRQFTRLVRAVPGVSESGPDRFGSIRFGARARMGDVYRLLPENAVTEARKAVPDTTRVAVDLWADAGRRPTWIGLNATGPAVRLVGSMTFRAYR
ncbi:hypothetical protein ACGFNU_07130 [Spirillospora sp. NPDC048911]|uniref:hypothetical protein n=1 Tax=Spirillospora sp. NPDC048911 TaxID=3364527 RepID=UPI0037124EBC